MKEWTAFRDESCWNDRRHRCEPGNKTAIDDVQECAFSFEICGCVAVSMKLLFIVTLSVVTALALSLMAECQTAAHISHLNGKFHLNDDLMHEERMPISDIDQSSACNSCNHTQRAHIWFFCSPSPLTRPSVQSVLSWATINCARFFSSVLRNLTHFSGECIVR